MHPADRPIFHAREGKHADLQALDFERFVASESFGRFQDRRLHLSLLPVPFGGDLERADIILLLLNPGLDYCDYYAETKIPRYRRRLEMTLAQDLKGEEFPFLWLDPEFCWHSGFRWWERKLHEVTWVIANQRFGGRYLDALRDLSRRIAHVQLVPYHSSTFQAHSLIGLLPSTSAAREYVRGKLVPAAAAGSKTIIATRGAKYWNLSPGPANVSVYPRSLSRSASLGPNSPGGRAILKRYGIC